jgi:hypothetical protein
MSRNEVGASPSEEMKRRPRPKGLAFLVILWFATGVYNLYVGLSGIKADLQAFQFLSSLPEWFRIGIPAEFALNVIVFVVSLVAMVIIYGLWTGKSWSDRLALGIPLSITVIDMLSLALYYSAPAEVQAYVAAGDVSVNWGVTLFSAFATVMCWNFLRQAEVKEYMSSRRISLRDAAIVVFMLAVVLGGVFVVQAIGEKIQPSNFVVINVDRTWNTEETQVTYRVEIQNLGGDGWKTLHFLYNETDQSTKISWTETKQWQVQLNSWETKIVVFTFNRHSMEDIAYRAEWWFT